MKIRAIYIGDVRFDQSPVFEYDKATNEFMMLIDHEFSYSLEIVENDPDFIIFLIEKNKVTKISKRKFSLMKSRLLKRVN